MTRVERPSARVIETRSPRIGFAVAFIFICRVILCMLSSTNDVDESPKISEGSLMPFGAAATRSKHQSQNQSKPCQPLASRPSMSLIDTRDCGDVCPGDCCTMLMDNPSTCSLGRGSCERRISSVFRPICMKSRTARLRGCGMPWGHLDPDCCSLSADACQTAG